jgi:hypothetical protein
MRLKAGGKRQRLRVAHFRNFPIVMRDEGLISKENVFYEHPEKMRRLHIKLQECTVIAIYFVRARSLGATLLKFS